MASVTPVRRKTPATTRTHTRTREDGSTFEQKGKARGNGEGSTFSRTIRHTRQDGTVYTKLVWCAYVPLPNGKRKTLYGKTQEEAAQRKREAERDLDAGALVTGARLTVAAYLAQWLEQSARPTLRARTYESYATRVHRHLIPRLGKVALAKLGPQQVQALQNDLLAAGKAPRTVINVRNTLSGALDQALRWGLIARNPVGLVDPPRVPDDGERLPMDEEQAGLLLDAIHGDRLEALYTVALALGLRRGEALGLRWEDVDLDGAELHIRRSLQRAEGRLQFLELKTRKSRRTVDLPATAVEALREQRERQAFERRAAGPLWQEQGLIFTSTIGTPLEPRNATRSFQLLLKRSGLPHQRFHDLRHACATLLLVQGVELKVVQEVLGHSSIMTTGNIYAHVLPRLKRDAAERMDGVLKRSGGARRGS